jgi:hypothetical protein
MQTFNALQRAPTTRNRGNQRAPTTKEQRDCSLRPVNTRVGVDSLAAGSVERMPMTRIIRNPAKMHEAG